MQAHAVELEAHPPLQLGVFGGGELPVLRHLAEGIEELVRVGDVALIEGEVVPQQRLAEALHPNEAAVVLGLVGHDGTPFLALGPL